MRKISFCLQKIVENSSFSDDIRFNENCFSLENPFCVEFFRSSLICNRQTRTAHSFNSRSSSCPLSTPPSHPMRTSIPIVKKHFYCIIFPRFIFGILTILLMFFRMQGSLQFDNDRQKRGTLRSGVLFVGSCANRKRQKQHL
jgi:hypothetical protein